MPDAAPQPARPGESEGPRRAALLRRVARAPLTWARLLVFPGDALPGEIAAGRSGGALLAATLAAAIMVVAVSLRLDMTPVFLHQELRPAPAAPNGGATPAMSDREFDEAVDKARAVEVVKLGAGVLLVPLRLLGLALALFLVARFVGGKPKFKAMAAVAAAAGLPGAVRALIAAGAALRRVHVTPDDVAALVPPPWGALDGPPLMRLAAACDPFTLWALAIVVVGLPHAAGVGRVKATVTVGVCFVLLRLVSL